MLGLITSLQGFSQVAITDTNNTAFPDTTISDPYEVICTPKYIMVQVIKDLKDYDIAKEELDAITQQFELQTTYIDQQDSLVVSLKNQCSNIGNMLQESSQLADTYKLRLDKVERKSVKKDGWIKGLAIGLVVSIITNFAIH